MSDAEVDDHDDFPEYDMPAESDVPAEVPEPVLTPLARSLASIPEEFAGLEADSKAASATKEEGNKLFAEQKFAEALHVYSRAIALCPQDEEHNYSRSVFHCNRAACYHKMEDYEAVVDDCTIAVDLQPRYVKALLRRSQAYEELDRLEDALADLKAVLEIDASLGVVRRKHEALQKQVTEKHEKMKEEMLSKLKDLGNTVLGKFGLSLNNFKMDKDPNTGQYSVNFVQGGAGAAESKQ